MGEVIGAHAAADDIADDVKKSFENALARGGDIAAAATSRLGQSVTAIDQQDAIRKTAHDAEIAAWAPVAAADHAADVLIGGVRDEMFNALDRPRSSPHMDHAFPGGIGTYTAGDPGNQPILMQVLTSRIQSASAPQWSDAKKQGWIASLDAARSALTAALEAHRPADAAVTVADAGFRAAARSGHSRLVAFKRDLKNLGLSEPQIHQIIPDTPRARSKPRGAGHPSAGTPPATTPPTGAASNH